MRRIVTLLALAAALAATSTADAGFQPIRRDSGEHVLPRVRAGVLSVPPGQRAGLVRVIVRLPLPPLAAAYGDELRAAKGSSARLSVESAGARAYLARLSRAQAAAVAELERAIPEARVDRRFRILLDGITVTLPQRRLPQLTRLAFVDKVYPSLRYTATLDTSPQVIGAPQFTQATGDGGQGVKIAVVDTGVDPTNPFFDASGYAYPGGFPKGATGFTTPKVIVARSFPGPGSGEQGRRVVVPEEFHGTHVAGIAAGNKGVTAPASEFHPAVPGLSGIAPRAWIGNYRVFTVPTPFGLSGNSPEIVAAFEAAVADGMDVINFSGGGPMFDPANDTLVEVVRNVAAAGVVPVIAAGNDRDDFGLGSVGSPGTAPEAISVAAVTNTHVFAQALRVTAPGAPPTLSQIAFEGAAGVKAPAGWATADQTLVDIRSIVGTDGRPVDRYLCAPADKDPLSPASTLPDGSLSRQVVLVWRGNCPFASKGERALAAGAAGLILVDNRPGNPNPIPVDMPLPTGMVTDLDGSRLDAYLTTAGGRTTIRIGRDIDEIANGRAGVVTSFSSAGPTAFGHLLKPDVAAPGSQILSSTPPAATRSTFFVLDGTSMATPHVAGAAALLVQRHPTWTPQQVKSALVSTAGPAWADSSGTQEAPVLLEGGGLVNVGRADEPLLFTEPASLSFGDLNASRGVVTKPLLLALSDATGTGGTWEVELRPQSATPGATLEVQPTVTLAPGGTVYLPVVARAASDAAVGDEYGFVVLRQGTLERRVPYLFSVTRPRLPLAEPPVPLRKLQIGDTRVGPSQVSVYRYPASPFGPPPSFTGPSMNESGSEHVYRIDIGEQATVNVGVSVLQATQGSLVHPWFLGALDENSVQGYGGTPVNVNPYTFDSLFDISAAGVVFPHQQTFYIAVDSGSDRLTGKGLPGQYLLNAWVDDVFPPATKLITTRVAAGRPLLVARVADLGSGVDPLSLVISYKRVLVGAAFYDPVSGLALFPLPARAPALSPGETPTTLFASDFQESKNIDTPGGAVLPNSAFAQNRIEVVDAPVVTWLLPRAAACVRSREGLVATASSTKPVRGVRFLVDGKRIGFDKGNAGLHSTIWKTGGVKKRRHVLTAVVTDAGGRTATAWRAVRVCN